MTFPILFPQYAKSSMDSSTKIPRKNYNSFAGYVKIEYYWYVSLYFKLCFQKEFSPLLVRGGNAEFHCLRW